MILTEQVINEVLQRLDEKVDTKINLKDDKHLAKLEYIMLFEMDFPLSKTRYMLKKIRRNLSNNNCFKSKSKRKTR